MDEFFKLNTQLKQSKAAGTEELRTKQCLTYSYTHSYSFSLCRTAIGLKCKDGVVLGMEKILHSKLLKRNTNRRIMTVDLHAGIVRLVLPSLGFY